MNIHFVVQGDRIELTAPVSIPYSLKRVVVHIGAKAASTAAAMAAVANGGLLCVAFDVTPGGAV